MRGTREDWLKLSQKFQNIQNILRPIEKELGFAATRIERSWWSRVEIILDKLIDTFDGTPDKDWWATIITEKKVHH